MTNTMGGTFLHRPPSLFQPVMIQQNTSQQMEPWAQMPQVPPLSMPWTIQNLPQSEVIRFTGEQTCMPTIHHKRKLDTSDMIDIRQTKQFITEEKMAAHFQDLHISSTYHPQNQVLCNSAPSRPPEKPTVELDIDTPHVIETDSSKSPKLVLSEELKRLQQEPILPSSLLSKLERPSLALVLWEPPNKHLRIFPTRDTPTPIPSASDDNNNSNSSNNNNNININDNNNSEGIPDLNQPPITIPFEPMDL